MGPAFRGKEHLSNKLLKELVESAREGEKEKKYSCHGKDVVCRVPELKRAARADLERCDNLSSSTDLPSLSLWQGRVLVLINFIGCLLVDKGFAISEGLSWDGDGDPLETRWGSLIP